MVIVGHARRFGEPAASEEREPAGHCRVGWYLRDDEPRAALAEVIDGRLAQPCARAFESRGRRHAGEVQPSCSDGAGHLTEERNADDLRAAFSHENPRFPSSAVECQAEVVGRDLGVGQLPQVLLDEGSQRLPVGVRSGTNAGELPPSRCHVVSAGRRRRLGAVELHLPNAMDLRQAT